MIRRPPISPLFPHTPLFRSLFLSEAFTRPARLYGLAKLGFTQSYTYFTWRTTKEELTEFGVELVEHWDEARDRKSTRLNSSHANISYAVFCLKKKKTITITS